MIYAKVVDGIITEIAHPTNPHFVFICKRRFKTFSLWLRVDQLDPVPEVGWHYNEENGFTED